MKFVRMCPILLMLFIMGCSSEYLSRTPNKYQSKEDSLNYLMAGFSTEYPNLYCDEPIYSKKCRLRKLIDAMGYQDFYYSWPDKGGGDELWYIKQTSDREQPYNEVLILSATGPPQVKMMYHNMIYNDFGREIATTDKDQNNKKHIKFNCGSDIVVDGPYHFDTTGTYYCKGGRRYCCQESTFVDEPIFVYSIDSPENPIYQSKLINFPEKMLFMDGSIILIAKSDADPQGLEVEVTKKQEDGNWEITEHYVVKPPRLLYAVRFLRLESFDPKTKNMIVYAKQDWPLGGELYFYDYQQKKLLRKSFLDYPELEFFYPTILKNSVQYVDLGKLRVMESMGE